MTRRNQIQESKNLIAEAMLTLLKQKSLNDINMSEIAKKADVVRMTLYRHFKTKEDIILSIVSERIDEYLDDLVGDKPITFNDFNHLRFHLLKNSPFTNMLFESNQLDKLLELIRVNTIERFEVLNTSNLNPFIIDFFVGGIDKITMRWIEEGMQIPPDVMAMRVNLLIEKLRQLMDQ